MKLEALFGTNYTRKKPSSETYKDMDSYWIDPNDTRPPQRHRYADFIDAYEGITGMSGIRAGYNDTESDFVIEIPFADNDIRLCRVDFTRAKIYIGKMNGVTHTMEYTDPTAGSEMCRLVWSALIVLESNDLNSPAYTYFNLLKQNKNIETNKECIYCICYECKQMVFEQNRKYNGFEVVPLDEDSLIVSGISDDFSFFSSNAATLTENIQYLAEESLITEENKGLIPTLLGKVIPPVAKNILEVVRFVGGRNFGVLGESGTGKSTIAVIIAAILHLPYRFVSCAKGLKATDLLVKIMPASKNEESVSDVTMLSFKEIQENPAFALLSFFHAIPQEAQDIINNKSIPKDERMDKLREYAFRAIMEETANHKEDGEYYIVDSELIKSVIEGGVCELQEVTLIDSPGILPVLNSLMDANASVVTMDGRRIKRHPNSIIIMTGNIGYAGCKEINESIKDRLDGIWVLPSLTANEMLERLLKEVPDLTQHSDILRRMATAVLTAKDYCVNNRLRGYTCGYRAYKDWCMSLLIPEKPTENREQHILNWVRSSVLSKCTTDVEEQRNILQSAIGVVFSGVKDLLNDWR